VFIIIVLSIWTILHLYVFWRAASVPLIDRHVSGWLLIVVAVFLWASYPLARILDSAGADFVARPLEFLGANWIGVIFLLFSGLLVADVVSGFGFLLPRLAPSLRGWGLVVGAALAAIALVQGLRPPVIRNYEVRLASLPADQDGTVLIVVSDLHLGTLLGERWLAARIAQIAALRPDLVVVAGDIIDGGGRSEDAMQPLLPTLRRLTAPLGVWAVTGNHEFYAGLDASVRFLEDAGFQVLRDRWAEVRPGLIIAGVDDLTARRQFARNGDPLERALAGRPESTATVFVSHTPWQADKAARAGVGLMLSGHTHDGQIWPFGYLVHPMYPLMGGRYEVGGMPVIVCRGTGTWGPRLRLWRPSEIVRIVLRAPSAARS